MSDIDHRLRASNYVANDVEPSVRFASIAARLEAERPATSRRRWRHPVAVSIATLALAGTATAAVVIGTTGPTSDIDRKATVGTPGAAQITALLAAGAPRTISAQERAAAPELGDAGPIKGISQNRDGFNFDIVADGGQLCITAHANQSAPNGSVSCTKLPIRFDMIPIHETSEGPESRTRIEIAVAPDGVRDFRATLRSGRTLTSSFIDNVATITYPGTETVLQRGWTTPDGRTITKR